MNLDINYKNWIASLKDKIRSAQIKAALSVNEQMIILYWDIGKSIFEKQQEHNWGSKIVEQMALDLKRELPDTNGFSRTNLFAMRKFYLFYANSELVQQAAGLIQNNEILIVHQLGGQLNQNAILFKIPWKN
jgi:predicted nuclease of restriction endonuclease-like (RecB) superfamily